MTTFSDQCMLHECHIPAARCHTCRLEKGMTDLCSFKRVLLPANSPELKPKAPRTLKGALPDFWIKSAHLTRFRCNEKNTGFWYDPEIVLAKVANKERLSKYEYMGYMSRAPHVAHEVIAYGDDSLIRESELDHYKDGGYAEDSDGQPALVTPYDAGLEPDDDLDEKLQEQFGTPDMWRQQGVAHHVVYQHSYHVNYVIAGSYSRTIKKVVYQPERRSIWYRPYAEDRPLVTIRTVRSEVEYREDNTVMRKQELPTLHPIMVGLEKCVVGSSTVRTRKDNRFLEVRKYEDQVVERHRKLLIHRDEVESVKRVAILV